MPSFAPTRSGHLATLGFDVFWERFGEGQRETVCLLNGLAMHTKAWYPFLDRLLPDYDVLLFDYPGQGESTSDDVPVTIPQLADILAAILDSEGLARVHTVGVSYGGFTAIEFARRHQARLQSMTLSGILLTREALFDLYQALSLRFYRGGPDVFELYTHYMYEKIFGEAFVQTVGIEKLDVMRQRFHERYTHRVHSLIRLTEAQDPFFADLGPADAAYRAISTPTLIMPGAEDRAIPASVQQKICGILRHAEWAPIPNAGHVVYLERPDLFWPRLRAFMGTHGQA